MPNKNPIYLDKDAEETVYEIPDEFRDSLISVSIKIELLQTGWQYAAAHSVFFRGNNLYPQKTPEPENLNIDIGINLKNKKLAVGATVSRIINGSDDPTPSKVGYHLIIKAGNIQLNDFTKVSNTNNPSRFDSLIKFKIQQ